MLECIEDTGEAEKRKHSDMVNQGSLLGKTEYDVLRRRSSFEDIAVDDDENADCSALVSKFLLLLLHPRRLHYIHSILDNSFAK